LIKHIIDMTMISNWF